MTAHFDLALIIQKHVRGFDISHLRQSILSDFLLSCRQTEQKVPQIILLKSSLLTQTVVNLFGQKVWEVWKVELNIANEVLLRDLMNHRGFCY